MSRENELFSAAIDMNRKQHVLQDRRLALKRIARESEAYEIGTQYHRNVIGELLSEISRLRNGQPIYTEEEDQLPIDAINAMTGDYTMRIPDTHPFANMRDQETQERDNFPPSVFGPSEITPSGR